MAYTASDFLTRERVTVAPGDPLRRAVDAMQERGCRRLPVLENDRLVGIITETDVSDALIRLLEQPGL